MRFYVTHSKFVIDVASKFGWLPGARYTNLRDVKHFDRLGFLDIDWQHYDFQKHLEAAMATSPMATVARDIEDRAQIGMVLDQACALAEHADRVIVVPKDPSMQAEIDEVIPDRFLLGYSVPTKYGATSIDPRYFRRPVHLLGGRPDIQRRLGDQMPIFSLDCNRFTLDAAYGDYFDGETFRPHPLGGYENCIRDSIINITELWENYSQPLSGLPNKEAF